MVRVTVWILLVRMEVSPFESLYHFWLGLDMRRAGLDWVAVER